MLKWIVADERILRIHVVIWIFIRDNVDRILESLNERKKKKAKVDSCGSLHLLRGLRDKIYGTIRGTASLI